MSSFVFLQIEARILEEKRVNKSISTLLRHDLSNAVNDDAGVSKEDQMRTLNSFERAEFIRRKLVDEVQESTEEHATVMKELNHSLNLNAGFRHQV